LALNLARFGLPSAAGPAVSGQILAQHHRRISGLRISATTCGLAVALVLVALAVRHLDASPFGLVLTFGAGVLVTPLAASPFEWFVHRYVYHRARPSPLDRIHAIHQAHHFAYFPTWRYVTGGPPRRIQILRDDIEASQFRWANALTRLAHFGFYLALGLVLICAPAYLISESMPFLLGTIAGLIVISDLFIRVHDAIHRPAAHPVLQRQRWFQFLDHHHFIHHVDLGANVNFLLPLADLLYGTLRRSLSPQEIERHGTREAAKSRVIGSGERARECSVSSSSSAATA
jgi:hypothetical protein